MMRGEDYAELGGKMPGRRRLSLYIAGYQSSLRQDLMDETYRY